MSKSGNGRRASKRDRAAPTPLSAINETAGYRHARLQEIIREEIEALLRDEVADPRVEPVRVTGIVLSVDYRHARVHFALARKHDERIDDVENALTRATPFLRARLADALDLKRVPDLRFVFDAEIAGEGRL